MKEALIEAGLKPSRDARRNRGRQYRDFKDQIIKLTAERDLLLDIVRFAAKTNHHTQE